MKAVYSVVLVAGIQFAAGTTSSGLLTIRGKALPNFKIAEKSEDFVNRIKANLRRDNDDYAESAPAEVSRGEGRRRLAPGTVPLRASTRLITHYTDTLDRPLGPRFTYIASEPPYNPFSLTALPYPAFSNNLPTKNVDKFKQFLQNKDLLKKYVSYKRLVQKARAARVGDASAPVAAMTPFAPPPRAQPVPTPGPPLIAARPTPRPRPGHAPPRDAPQLADPLHIDYEELHAQDIAEDSNQLDLSPARVRGGRMCHRHVLMPEGPKYDSKGRIYVKEFAPPRPGLDYAHTRPPRHLLPRCCNCCKKSVLGCE